MKPFTSHEGQVVPLDRVDVDKTQIIQSMGPLKHTTGVSS